MIGVGMVAAGLGYHLNPSVARWIIIPTVLVLWLALLATIIYRSARRMR